MAYIDAQILYAALELRKTRKWESLNVSQESNYYEKKSLCSNVNSFKHNSCIFNRENPHEKIHISWVK